MYQDLDNKWFLWSIIYQVILKYFISPRSQIAAIRTVAVIG